MIRYESSLTGVTPEHLTGFFVGWPSEVSGERLLAILRGSTHAVLAWQDAAVVGFINSISDGVFSAFVPLLEVRPDHQGRGIGKQLVATMLDIVRDMYSLDLVCDEALVPFYESVGGQRLAGIGWRNRPVLSQGQ